MTNHKNLVITDRADENAALRDENARLHRSNMELVDLIADLAWNGFIIGKAGERELLERIHTEATLD